MKGKTIFVILIFFGNVLFATEKVRQYWNNIGYCKTPEQIEKIVDLSLELENKIKKNGERYPVHKVKGLNKKYTEYE